jgi:hypothetical protein
MTTPEQIAEDCLGLEDWFGKANARLRIVDALRAQQAEARNQAQKERIDELEKGLSPLSAMAGTYQQHYVDECLLVSRKGKSLNAGHCRRAAELLRKEGK